MKIGVLALQGDFEAHGKRLRELGAAAVEVRYASQLDALDGLILPGGESTTNAFLLDEQELWEPLEAFARSKPMLGTCAGAILMAREVGDPPLRSLAAIEMTLERNAYGRQAHSSIRVVKPEAAFVERSRAGDLEAVFIRAPIIRRVGPHVVTLLREGEDAILVEEGRHLAATFHPELTSDTRLHEIFLAKVRQE